MRGIKAAANRAAEYANYFGPIVTELKSHGQTLQGIAAELKRMGYETRRGKPWNYVAVLRLLEQVSRGSAS